MEIENCPSRFELVPRDVPTIPTDAKETGCPVWLSRTAPSIRCCPKQGVESVNTMISARIIRDCTNPFGKIKVGGPEVYRTVRRSISSATMAIFMHMTTFKELGPGDIERVVLMMRQFSAIDNYPFDSVERSQNLQLVIDHPGYGRLWLIFQDDVLAGYIFLGFGFSFEFKGRDAFVDELFILPEFQGKGIGKLAIDFIVSEARKAGVKALHLEAEHHNSRGLRLYRQKGFKDHNRFLLTKYL